MAALVQALKIKRETTSSRRRIDITPSMLQPPQHERSGSPYLSEFRASADELEIISIFKHSTKFGGEKHPENMEIFQTVRQILRLADDEKKALLWAAQEGSSI